ncbi:MAG: adenylate/guanylate cyclase domain-containing protein [Azonexus sp.]|jgi:class 3 adenylate cyclase|nr:adenylate/guanylate cyclase domain-containing protein [Azonexus sp.]
MSRSPLFPALHHIGLNPADDAETRLKKSLLIFATGLVSFGSMLWLFLYGQLGPRFSVAEPFTFQLLLVGNLLFFFYSGHFNFFRYSQLALFLFAPFAVQWGIGNFITASGASLWGLLAPIGAVLIFSPRESIAWFIAYLFLTALSGFFDYYLADNPLTSGPKIAAETSVFFFALNFAAVSSIVYLLLRYAVIERARARAELEATHERLQAEQERSERLLLNILPAPIAERLKRDKTAIADGFAEVTVMFADIVDFTRIAEGMTPEQVFAMLNRVFSAFDELAEQYGVEKIKTIGDAYMVAGGLNHESGDYTRAVAELALAMHDVLRRDFADASLALDLRIGISTGPVVAGVVGRKKFIYDLWGDTVNLASRITSDGVAGVIQVDARTQGRLAGCFRFAEARRAYLKGKGATTVYRLLGPLEAEAETAVSESAKI